MLKALTILAAVLFAMAQPARTAAADTGRIDLSWNDCRFSASSTTFERFACNTNMGVHTLVGSFLAPADIMAMSANEFVIDIVTAGATLADWWAFGTGRCRPQTSLQGNFDFTGGPDCYDYWQDGAVGSLTEDAPVGNGVRIRGVVSLPAGDPRITSIPQSTLVYSFKAVINNEKTMGLGSCGGCAADACILLRYIRIVQAPPFQTYTIIPPLHSNYVIWQGWDDIANGFCPEVTPAKKQTWGSIKALYR